MENDWDPKFEWQYGVLCEDGFMKERYDFKSDELVRSFTPKGLDVIKDILKDPKYQKIFVELIKKESKEMTEEQRSNLIMSLREQLC